MTESFSKDPSKPDASEKTRRLFFAIEISEEIRADLADLTTRLQKASNFTPARISWVAPENLHITLYFLGNIRESIAESMRVLMQETAADSPAFDIDCRHLGVFPREKPRPPRVLWVGLHQPPEELHQLRDVCASIILKSGLTLPDQDFSPHLTLARFKSTKGLKPFLSMMREHTFHKAGKCTVNRLVLMESITGGGPARYTPYETVDLKKI